MAAGGLPFAEDAQELAEGLAQLLGYNVSAQKSRQELLEGTFGRSMAEFCRRRSNIDHMVNFRPAPTDKAIKPRHGHIVVAVVDGEFTVKYLYQRAGRIKLKPANVTFPEITPKEGQTIEVWGVVTSSIKRFIA